MAGRKSASKKKRKSGNGRVRATSSKMAAKKLPSFKGTLTKSGMIRTITDTTDIGKKDVVAVLDCFTQLIEKHVKGPGKFVLPGVLKITVVKKKARPAREGVNPFTGERVTFKAKPAYKAVKIKPLKKLKEMVA